MVSLEGLQFTSMLSAKASLCSRRIVLIDYESRLASHETKYIEGGVDWELQSA